MEREVSGRRRSVGREYRLSRDARLRQARDRRTPGVPDALSGADGVERGGAAAELKSFLAAGSPNPAARTPAPPAALVRLSANPSTTYVGIDVGEDFLDLAIVNPRARSLRFARVALTGLSGQSSVALARRIIEAAPELDAHPVAMVDSPRWPCDL